MNCFNDKFSYDRKIAIHKKLNFRAIVFPTSVEFPWNCRFLD